jgi:hypothetical protein
VALQPAGFRALLAAIHAVTRACLRHFCTCATQTPPNTMYHLHGCNAGVMHATSRDCSRSAASRERSRVLHLVVDVGEGKMPSPLLDGVRRVNAAFSQALRRAKVPRGEAGTVAGAAAESVQAASDAAHGRWVKLLNARRGGSISHWAAPLPVLVLGFHPCGQALTCRSHPCVAHCPAHETSTDADPA